MNFRVFVFLETLTFFKNVNLETKIISEFFWYFYKLKTIVVPKPLGKNIVPKSRKIYQSTSSKNF